ASWPRGSWLAEAKRSEGEDDDKHQHPPTRHNTKTKTKRTRSKDMNHLCGLSLSNLDSSANSAPVTDFSGGERRSLDAFRRRYDSALRGELGFSGRDGVSGRGANDNNHDSDDGFEEEKKDASVHPSPGRRGSKSPPPPLPPPAYLPSPDDLPPSVLRPLDDVTLYRYLLADRRSDGTFDEVASFRRLLEALKFRRERGCDEVARNLASDRIPATMRRCRRLRVGVYAGVDDRSRPVVFERLGQFLLSGNATKVTHEEWTESYLYFLEGHFAEMRRAAEASGKAVDRIVYFADFQGVVTSVLNRKIWKVVPLLKELVKTVECHYPEIVDHITLFNVPRVASGVYNVVRGFLDPVTAAKIELHAGVPYERFRELMSEDVIPAEYGGKNEMDFPQTASCSRTKTK
ncbi:hypothetical protein ACHAWF_006592, partial [Thalassiosira exigua]